MVFGGRKVEKFLSSLIFIGRRRTAWVFYVCIAPFNELPGIPDDDRKNARIRGRERFRISELNPSVHGMS
jgi:hypothetical protein